MHRTDDDPSPPRQRRIRRGWAGPLVCARGSVRRILRIIGPAILLPIVGCAAGSSGREHIGLHATSAPAPRSARADAAAERIRRDPVAFLRDVKKRCDALTAYRLTFYRQERLGLLGSLRDMEKITAKFRAAPFSVKFEWPDPDAYLYESVYVAGANDDKLIVRERHGWLGFPPTTRYITTADPVKWSQSKRPITDFGLSAMMARTLRTIDDPPLGQPAEIAYRGTVLIEQTGVLAHHLVILRATTKDSPCPRQDLWIDVNTELPAGTALVLPDDRIDALYLYADVHADGSLGDGDFAIASSGKGKTAGATDEPRKTKAKGAPATQRSAS